MKKMNVPKATNRPTGLVHKAKLSQGFLVTMGDDSDKERIAYMQSKRPPDNS